MASSGSAAPVFGDEVWLVLAGPLIATALVVGVVVLGLGRGNNVVHPHSAVEVRTPVAKVARPVFSASSRVNSPLVS